MNRLDTVVAQHARHNNPYEWQRNHSGDQHDRGEMEDTHFRHAEIHRDRYDQDVGRCTDRRRHSAYKRCCIEWDERFRRSHRTTHGEVNKDRHQEHKDRSVVDAHRQQECDYQREQQAEL